MISFRNISRDNFQAVIAMDVNDFQKGFMEGNLYSLAECSFEEDFVPKAIYDDETPVGFMLYYFVPGDPDYVFLHRFMIDRRWQGKRLGNEALRASVGYFRQEYPSIGCIELMHYPDNIIGATLYKKLGFEMTGEIRESEPCLCDQGTSDENRFREIVRRHYY